MNDRLANSQRHESLLCAGATCELLGRMLSDLAHGAQAASNPYLTSEDFRQLRELDARLNDLRQRAGCADFIDTTVALVESQVADLVAVAEDFRDIFSTWTEADEAYRAVVRKAVERLRTELFLMEKHSERSHDARAVRWQIEAFCLTDASGIDLTDASGVGHDSIDLHTLRSFRPNPEAIRQVLEEIKAALENLRRQAHDLANRSTQLVAPAVERLTARRMLIHPGEHKPLPIDLDSLTSQGNYNAFLKFSNPPALKNFALDEGLALFINVAEDTASGKLKVSNAGTVIAVYKAFMASVSEADRAISSGRNNGPRFAERLHVAEELYQLLEKQLDPVDVQEAAATLLTDVDAAEKLMKRALQLVKIGDIANGIRLSKLAIQRSDRLIDARMLDEPLQEQQQRWDALERSFAALEQEGARQRKGWRGALGEVVFLNSHDELRRRLEAFYRQHAACRLGPGTEMGRKHGKLVRRAADLCQLVGYRPSLRVWFVVQDALEKVKTRSISPDGAFFNALCAIASAHASIDEAEERVIIQTALDCGLNIPGEQLQESIEEWRSVVSGKRLVAAVAQTVADVDAITDPRMLEQLNEALKNVVRSDDSVSETESAVYHAFLTRIAQQVHGTIVIE